MSILKSSLQPHMVSYRLDMDGWVGCFLFTNPGLGPCGIPRRDVFFLKKVTLRFETVFFQDLGGGTLEFEHFSKFAVYGS